MDIFTLNAVIAELNKNLERHEHMMRWASERNDEQAIDMWCNTVVECKENIETVSMMLNAELDQRDQEVA